VRAELGFPYHGSAKHSAQDALNRDLLAHAKFAADVVNRHTGADTCASGRAIDLPIRKHAHVPTVVTWIPGLPDHDDPVQEGEVLFQRVGELDLFHHPALDQHGPLHEEGHLGRVAAHPKIRRLDKGVVGAPKGEIIGDPPESGDLDSEVKTHDVGGDIMELDAGDPALIHLGEYSDQPSRSINLESIAGDGIQEVRRAGG